ncbi:MULTISPECIES: helix-turn-helix domain-containing protein [Trichocoleus]|uniref:Winged helix-turn-helix transcriptional regulator n=1 Tax=Trichocoleus desertorum GB2-A4 TaxID=2933944 RepID=A0ABV0JHN2_9CYAN|nr:winged helix-turn-helix transcriptional regulator [Trichocoleus sp. FACHB-46]MBD1865316.1 winged helix-turn-helix transcriptional regulator [Trichocoleus sp. FACHB-46]
MTHEPAQGTIFVQTTLKVLGGKWKILILWHLKDGARRFSELKRLLPEITEKMLIQQLRELERDGIVNRNIYSEVPPKVEYSFTEYGLTLKPVLQILCSWGENHLKHIE